jgi:hypothetical protein
MLKFNIDTEPDKYFHQLIEILRIFPPFNKLRKRQREVFSEILLQYYKFRNENDEVTKRLVFDYRTKQEIAVKLKISKGNLYNIYKELRQHKLLLKDGINPKFRYGYLQHEEIIFNLMERK